MHKWKEIAKIIRINENETYRLLLNFLIKHLTSYTCPMPTPLPKHMLRPMPMSKTYT